jgi:hypothetical protein
MAQPPEFRLPWWRALQIFMAWTVPVYALSMLTFAASQGWSVLRSWSFHLTFLIPAVIVGGIGALVLTNSSPARSIRGAMRGAATGLVSSVLGAVASCCALTAPASEGRAWFGVLQIPVIIFAAGTGFVIGMIYSSEQQSSNSA